MAVTITYHKKISNESISSYTRQWATDFGDMTLALSDNSDENYIFQLGAYNPADSGNLYAFGRINPQQSSTAISAKYVATISEEGDDLFNQHVTSAISGSLDFGEKISPISDTELKKDQVGHDVYFQLKNEELKFDGLDIADDIENSFYMLLHSYHHHDCIRGKDLGIYSLLRGDAEPILNKLKSQGIDVDIPLKDMAIATQFEEHSDIISNVQLIDTVGVLDNAEILLAA